ncbi:MAG: response regulator [Nitrospiraceae bacterium]
MHAHTHSRKGEPFRVAAPGASGAIDAPDLTALLDGREDGVALVIDDHSCVRALLAWVLADEGIQACEAASGDEGLLMARSIRPDLVCVDLDMPGGGLAVIGRLREVLPTATVIALTDSPRASLRDAVLAEGGDDMLEKPFHPDELRCAVAAARLRAGMRIGPHDPTTTFVDSL